MSATRVTIPAPWLPYPGDITSLSMVQTVLRNVRFNYALGGSGVTHAMAHLAHTALEAAGAGPAYVIPYAPWGVITIPAPMEADVEGLRGAAVRLDDQKRLKAPWHIVPFVALLESVAEALAAAESPWIAASLGDLVAGDRVRVHRGDFDRMESVVELHDGLPMPVDVPAIWLTEGASGQGVRIERYAEPDRATIPGYPTHDAAAA